MSSVSNFDPKKGLEKSYVYYALTRFGNLDQTSCKRFENASSVVANTSLAVFVPFSCVASFNLVAQRIAPEHLARPGFFAAAAAPALGTHLISSEFSRVFGLMGQVNSDKPV